MRFCGVHIGDHPPNQATTFESQQIQGIQYVFGQTLTEMDKNADFQKQLKSLLARGIFENYDHRFRSALAGYIHGFVLGRFQQELQPLYEALDIRLAALKYFAVMVMPEAWAQEDAIRLLLDGTDTGSALVGSAGVGRILSCQGVNMCADPVGFERYMKEPPFWWGSSLPEPVRTVRCIPLPTTALLCRTSWGFLFPIEDSDTTRSQWKEVFSNAFRLPVVRLKALLEARDFTVNSAAYHPDLASAAVKLEAMVVEAYRPKKSD